MKPIFLHYPNCDSCRKAKKWLDSNGVDVEMRHIIEQPPTEDELREWIPRSGLPVQKFFNTSGQSYRNGGYKEKIKSADEKDMIQWLAADGMLVKRPLLVGSDQVTVGFKEDLYEKAWGRKGTSV